MFRFLAAILTFISPCLFLAADSQPTILHVSPDGNDRNPGTRDRPLATLRAARDAIRKLKRGGGKQPITVLVHGGRYVLTEPLLFTAQDSGTKDAPVIYAAVPGENPVFSGGRRLTGWKEVTLKGKKLWAAAAPGVQTGSWYFRELWVNGRRRTRARHPNRGFLHIAGLPDAGPKTPWNRGQDRFQFAAGDIRPWENLQDVDIVVLHLWVAARLRVDSIDSGRRVVKLTRRSGRRLTDGEQPARYFVENAFEFLDEPGEWYLNRKTGVVYYVPMPGEKMSEVEAVAPVLPYLLRLEGRPERGEFVSHLVLRGLGFEHSEWPLQADDPADAQAAAPIPAAIQADGAEDCAFERCTVARAGSYGIHLGRGCRDNRISDCDLDELGAGGIKIGEMVQRANPQEQTHHNEVLGTHIHDGGRMYPQAVGVWIGQSRHNRIARNHIHHLFYTGISVGWTWGYGQTLAHDNAIELNHVHHIGQGRLSDMGGIYTLGVQPGTVIRSNIFHDIAAYRYGGWGIYLDEGSTSIVVENNLVYRTTHGGFHQHYGKENVIRNNIFAFGRDAQIQRTRIEPHRSFTFEHNIVYWKEGKLLAGDWGKMQAVFDRNLYWHVGGGPIRFAGLSWDQWRRKGMDRHSLYADPRFVNPENGDFQLRDASPAGKIGFRPLDLSSVGKREAEKRGMR
jgi:parallel beta-helix repeat protein